MLKHAYNDFPSDMFLLLEAAGATIVINTSASAQESLSPLAFLAMDMTKKLISNSIYSRP